MNNTTQLTVVETKPAELHRIASDVAGLCRQIVLSTAVHIEGRKYVKVEGWQSIATAHGCVASCRDVKRVEGGFSAIGEIRRMSDGSLLATAEGFVGEDEITWFGGVTSKGKTLPKRKDYAIRAMAQTRAISRVCRSAFAHVVVLMDAGLSTTPAEEVPAEGFDDNNKPEPVPVRVVRPAPMPYGAPRVLDVANPTAPPLPPPAPQPDNSWEPSDNAGQVDAEPVDWQNFPIPFGKNKGVPLGELRPASLQWYFENITVRDTDDAGKPRPEAWIAKDREFRAALDAAFQNRSSTVEAPF